MAIKVRHDGSAAPTIAGSFAGGRGKRAAEDARAFAQIRAQEDQKAAELAQQRQLEAMRMAASLARPGQAHAQLIHAPLTSAHAVAPTPGGISRTVVAPRAAAATAAKEPPGTFRYSSRQSPEGATRLSSGAGGGTGDYKVTGTSVFDRPDAESQWDPGNGGRWVRPWLPGEKEAEAQQRIGDVKDAQVQDMYEFKLTADQKNELAKINKSIEDARRSGRFSDEEMAELERQAYAQRMGIKPLPVPKEKMPDPVIRTDAQGREWLMNGNNWESVDALTNKGVKDDFAQLVKLVPDSKTVVQTNPATGKQEPVEVPLTTEERMAELEKLRQMRDKFNWSKPGKPTATEAAPTASGEELKKKYAQYAD